MADPQRGAAEERAREALATIVHMFETGDLPAAVAKTVIDRQQTNAPSARWSLGNRLLQLAAKTQDGRGYRQWQEVDRHVRQGAHAFYILAPRTVPVTVTDEQTGEERHERRCVGFLAVPVFRVEDTDGAPVAQPDYRPAELPPLFPVAEAWGIPVAWQPADGRGFYGVYYPREDRIVLCTHDVETFFHELAHAAHNRIRPLVGGQNPTQEIVAETVAAVLCHLYGLDGYLWHGAEYVRGYARGENAGRAVMRLLGEIEAVLDLILGAEAAAAVRAA